MDFKCYDFANTKHKIAQRQEAQNWSYTSEITIDLLEELMIDFVRKITVVLNSQLHI